MVKLTLSILCVHSPLNLLRKKSVDSLVGLALVYQCLLGLFLYCGWLDYLFWGGAMTDLFGFTAASAWLKGFSVERNLLVR